MKTPEERAVEEAIKLAAMTVPGAEAAVRVAGGSLKDPFIHPAMLTHVISMYADALDRMFDLAMSAPPPILIAHKEGDRFVLRLDTDPTARHAARTYARNIESKNPLLARDLRERCDKWAMAEIEAKEAHDV